MSYSVVLAGALEHSSLSGQIGFFPQEAIGDDELMVGVAGVRSRTVDHPPEEPVAVKRGDRSQLVVTGASHVTEVPRQRAVTVQLHQQGLGGLGYAGAGWILCI